MAQKYRIYINDNTLLITDSLDKRVEKNQQLDAKSFDFITFYKLLKRDSNKNYVLLAKDPKTVLKYIKKKLTLIKAAGGLVENAKGEYLFIFRNKKWDLPKGKVEKGEKIRITAVREVEEECGIKIYKQEERLCKTFHIYELGPKIILKQTSWYKMLTKGSPKLVPQTEEGITEAVWVLPDKIKVKTKNTYPLILEVLEAGDLV